MSSSLTKLTPRSRTASERTARPGNYSHRPDPGYLQSTSIRIMKGEQHRINNHGLLQYSLAHKLVGGRVYSQINPLVLEQFVETQEAKRDW